MRKVALLLVIVLLGVTTTTILAADPEPSSGAAAAPLIEGQSLADALNGWDGYDFTDAGDTWPGALRSGPSADSDPTDAFGGDGTILILPALDEPSHVLLRVRLSEAGDPAVWGNLERIMSELALSPDEQQAVYGGFGQVLGAAYADAGDEPQTHDSVVWVANAVALWQASTQGFEATPEGESDPLVSTPMGGVQLEIVPMGMDAEVLPMPSPTTAPQVEPTEEPTAEPTRTPRPTRSPRPTPKPTKKPSATATTGQAPAPGNDDWICDGSEEITGDPFLSGWNVARVDWSKRNGFDRIIVSLDRRKASGENFEVQAMTKVLPADEVGSTLDVKQPSQGDIAIGLGFMDDVRLGWKLDRSLSGLNTVRSITLGKDGEGVPWLVVGSDGDGCYSLQVPAWTAHHPEEDARVQVFLDIKRP